MVTDSGFFDFSREQSKIKSEIVSHYFSAWANVIIPSAKRGSKRIAYIDLFAGAGRYRDGQKSTPLLVLEKAIANPDLCEMLVAIFNDKNPEIARGLREAIASLPSIEKMRHAPRVENYEVGERLVEVFAQMTLVPTLLFLDPWGYKGLSLDLVNSVVKDWACECIFFFNYLRINMALNNKAFRPHMERILGGPERVDPLLVRIEGLGARERERVVMEELIHALRESHSNYVIPFRFPRAGNSRTSHYLVFVSKHFLGYHIMKEIMAKRSSTQAQGVPSFEYDPVEAGQGTLFEVERPLDELEEDLPRVYTGRKISMKQIYEDHTVGTCYLKRNYKQALQNLEDAGKIRVSKHRRGSFADNVEVEFP